MPKIFDMLKTVVNKTKDIEVKGKEAIARMKKQAESASKAGEQVRADKE